LHLAERHKGHDLQSGEEEQDADSYRALVIHRLLEVMTTPPFAQPERTSLFFPPQSR
jgi:hypothetical protein